jgi:hypothetical protein
VNKDNRELFVTKIYIADMLWIIPLLASAAAAPCISAAAFQPSSTSLYSEMKRSSALPATRREVVGVGTLSSVATVFALTTSFVAVSPKQVLASGGATAGGAYLLSVRLRCYTKVTHCGRP